MNEPLSKSQTELQGQDLGDMTVEQLFDWLDACSKMERWVKPQKARAPGIKVESKPCGNSPGVARWRMPWQRTPDRHRIGVTLRLGQGPEPVEPAAGDLGGVVLPERAVEELQRERAAVADRPQVGDHAGQVGDSFAEHHPVGIGLRQRVGTGGNVVDVEAGEPRCLELEEVVDRAAASDHVEDVGNDCGVVGRRCPRRSPRPGRVS